jgi:hypothetical protein
MIRERQQRAMDAAGVILQKTWFRNIYSPTTTPPSTSLLEGK